MEEIGPQRMGRQCWHGKRGVGGGDGLRVEWGRARMSSCEANHKGCYQDPQVAQTSVGQSTALTETVLRLGSALVDSSTVLRFARTVHSRTYQ